MLSAFAALEVVPDRLQLGRQLGKGQFGTVHIAIFLNMDGSKTDVAVKRMLASGTTYSSHVELIIMRWLRR